MAQTNNTHGLARTPTPTPSSVSYQRPNLPFYSDKTINLDRAPSAEGARFDVIEYRPAAIACGLEILASMTTSTLNPRSNILNKPNQQNHQPKLSSTLYWPTMLPTPAKHQRSQALSQVHELLTQRIHRQSQPGHLLGRSSPSKIKLDGLKNDCPKQHHGLFSLLPRIRVLCII